MKRLILASILAIGSLTAVETSHAKAQALGYRVHPEYQWTPVPYGGYRVYSRGYSGPPVGNPGGLLNGGPPGGFGGYQSGWYGGYPLGGFGGHGYGGFGGYGYGLGGFGNPSPFLRW